MKKHLLEYMETNDLILKEHHGGIARHNTLTAKALIDYRVGAGIDQEQNKCNSKYRLELSI